jgi:hypothetical protein
METDRTCTDFVEGTPVGLLIAVRAETPTVQHWSPWTTFW